MTKFDRFDVFIWAVLAALGLAIAGVVAVGDQVGARVLATLPPAGGEAGAGGRVGIEFAEPMQAESVQARFSLQPAADGAFRWEGRQVWFQPAQALTPGLTYTVQLEAGALSAAGRSLKQPLTWQFQVRAPWVAYLAPSSGGREIWRVPASGGPAQQLTHTDGRVYDFAVSRDGESLAYSLVNDQNGADLWRMARDGTGAMQLAACGADICSVPAWAPSGLQIAYSREPAGLAPGAPHGPPRVWLVDLSSGQTAPLYPDSQVLGYGPAWSPDGTRLAFFDGAQGGIRLFELASGQDLWVPTLTGSVGAWSPDSGQMLLTDMNLEGGQPSITLLRADFDRRRVEPLTGLASEWSDFGTPAWSPDGEWVALSLRAAGAGPARQLWLLKPEGRAGRAVTDDPAYTYSAYAWDPWGTGLVFQRFALNTAQAAPELVAWSMASGTLTLLAQDGAFPKWLP